MSRLCECGCGDPVPDRRSDALYAHGACRTRAHRQRQAAAALAAGVTPLSRKRRFIPTTQRVLQVLQAVGATGATTRELCQPNVGGVRFGARIMELREAGFEITCVRERNGSSRYRLLARVNIERAA